MQLRQESWTRPQFGQLQAVLLEIERLKSELASKQKSGIYLQEFGVRTAEEAGWGIDNSAAMQRAIDYVSSTDLLKNRKLIATAGHFPFRNQLKLRPRVTIEGEGLDTTTVFNVYGDDNLVPITLFGDDSPGGVWTYHVHLSNLFIEAGAYDGSATEIFSILDAYSCDFDRITIGSVQDAYTPLKITNINDLTFYKFKSGGATTNLPQHVLVDSSSGHIWKLCFICPDTEQGIKGFNFTGANSLIAEIISPYTEQLGTCVYWDGSHQSSSLGIFGGSMLTSNNTQIGVDIRRSNCSVIGLNVSNGGGTGVTIDNATTWDNCHVIGGNLNVDYPVVDTYARLKTNTYL